jgi:hypothetical protein
MILYKLLLVLALAFTPIHLIFARKLPSWIVLACLIGFWLLYPEWGPWVYAGVCLNLIQFRAWLIYINRVDMATYVFSPSMAIQNGSSLELAIGAVVGGIRSFIGGDLTGAIMGGVIAGLLFFLQGILFPNNSVILQACGDPMVDIEKLTDPSAQGKAIQEIMRLLEKVNYPALLKFNRQMRRDSPSVCGPMLTRELAQWLESLAKTEQRTP